MIDITVKVPEERVGEFYSMFGTWLSGSPPGLPTPGTKTVEGDRDALQPWSDADTELAAEVWGKLSAPAKRLFSTLIDNPGSRFDGETLGEMLELPNGKHSVAGLLGWPGRYCHEVNRKWLWSFDYPDGELADYWFTPEDAALFREVRDRQG